MRYLASIATVFMVFGYWAQLPISVFDCSINDPTVTQAEIDANDVFYQQCVQFTGSNYLFDQTDNKNISARTEIRIEEGFHAGGFSSTGQMHLKLEEKENLDVFSMNQADLGAIPQFDKLELGIDLPNQIDQQISDFFNDVPNTSLLSPFDPQDISVEADFYYYYEPNGTWLPQPVKIFGFYFEDFLDTGTDWQNENTPYDFRIRYTPRILGKWKCEIKVLIDEVELFKANDFVFEVVPSSLKDFTRVGVNKRYFEIGNETFFPVGQNLPWPGTGSGNYSTVAEDDIGEFHKYHDDMQDLADAGANYFRYILNPWSNGIEFEKLGHYEDRLNRAWETDRILDHARDLGLRIHFNLQVHYPFERTNPGGVIFWDWSKNDAPGAYPNCNYFPQDLGYCYSTELNLLTPEEFLVFEDQNQNPTDAAKFYKMRLRYIISRWGYSPEISVLELFSEANNIGNHANLVYDDPQSGGGGGCPAVDPNLEDPYLDDWDQAGRVYAWQNEMCRYIKEDLHHKQHPLGVNYTGHPIYEGMNVQTQAGCNMLLGDLSYYSDYTDFWTWNSYTYNPEQFEKHVAFNNNLNANNNWEEPGSPLNIDKPLMYSEIGLAGPNCDYNVTWKQLIALSPFDGSSGGFSWHHNNTGSTPIAYRNNLWKTYGYVNEFIKGVELDNDNWHFDYQDRNDNEAEVLYLRRDETFYRAAMGAIHNKTINFYTLRDSDDSDSHCVFNESELSQDVYKNAKTVRPGKFGNSLQVTDMGSDKNYWIKWYNPFTGYYYPTTSATTDNSGNLKLNFPPLWGNGNNSVLLFKAYREGQPSFQPEVQMQEVDNDYLMRDFGSTDENPNLEPSRSSSNRYTEHEIREVIVVPNPNNGMCRILYEGEADVLEITNSIGKPIFMSSNPISGEELDLSGFSSGVYFVILTGSEINLQTKFVIR